MTLMRWVNAIVGVASDFLVAPTHPLADRAITLLCNVLVALVMFDLLTPGSRVYKVLGALIWALKASGLYSGKPPDPPQPLK